MQTIKPSRCLRNSCTTEQWKKCTQLTPPHPYTGGILMKLPVVLWKASCQTRVHFESLSRWVMSYDYWDTSSQEPMNTISTPLPSSHWAPLLDHLEWPPSLTFNIKCLIRWGAAVREISPQWKENSQNMPTFVIGAIFSGPSASLSTIQMHSWLVSRFWCLPSRIHCSHHIVCTPDLRKLKHDLCLNVSTFSIPWPFWKGKK